MKIQKLNPAIPTPKVTKIGYELIGTEVKKLHPIDYIDLEGDVLEGRFESHGRFYCDAGERVLIGTGLKIESEEGSEIRLQSTQEQYLLGVLVQNTHVPTDYTGELCIILKNTSGRRQWIDLGKTIAILTVYKIWIPEITEEEIPGSKVDSFNLVKKKVTDQIKPKLNSPLFSGL